MKKLFGLFSTTLLATLMCVGLTNRVKEKAPETAAPRQTLEVRDVLRKGAEDGEGNVVRRNAAAPTTYGMSDAKIQVTAPDENERVDIRFVAGIDSFDYSNAQFTIIMHNEDGPVGSITREVTSAYMAIELEGEVKTAAEVFGEGYDYFIAYTLKGMPKTDWLNNSFEIGTGLKQAEDVEYTEHYTEEIKSVNEAVRSDYLLFTWKPYNEFWGTLTWENDFYASQADASLDPEMDGYGESINSALKQKVVATITDENGNKYTGSGTHAVGNAYQTHSINMQFVNFSTQFNAYTLDVEFTYDVVDEEGNIVGQNTVRGHKEFTRLANVENAVVTPEEDGSFTLAFDNLANASSYAYKIYNDTFTGEEIKVVSGDTLATATLDVGTYNIDIIAYGDYNAPSTTTLTDAFTVENVAEVLDGTGKFTFDVAHKGTAWENVLAIYANDPADAVTNPGKISDFKVNRILVSNGEKSDMGAYFINQTTNGIKGNETPSYNTTINAYTFGFKFHESPKFSHAYYEVSFIIQTDAGTLYQVAFYYFVEDSITIENENESELMGAVTEYFVEQFTNTYDAFVVQYGENANAQATYEESVAELQAAKVGDIMNLYEELVGTLEASFSGMVKLNWDTTYGVDSDGANDGIKAVDGDTGSRWESTHSEPHYLIVRLAEVSSIGKLEIVWEGASAKDYDVYVSETGEDGTWVLAYSFTGGSGGRTDTLEFAQSYNAQYVKIDCKVRSTGWGFSIFEMYAYGGPKA